MNILYCIFTHSHGNGGHYYSFETITKTISSQVSCKRMEIGWNKSPVVNPDIYIKYNPFIFIFAFLKILFFLRENGFDIVHCFDEHSFFLLRLPCFLLKKKIILTRCGGANPSRYYPVSENLLCFSDENASYFREKSEYKHVAVIPNRCEEVSDVSDNVLRNNNILSIARIGSNYYTKHSKAIELIRLLNSKNINASLDIVGVVEEDAVLEKLIAQSSGLQVNFHTDKSFTKEASRLIPSYKFIVGTGRGAMEAMGYGKPVLCIGPENDLPFLVTESNFHQCLSYNFSTRIPYQDLDLSFMPFIDDAEYNRYSKLSFDYFKDYLNISNAKESYINFYNSSELQKMHLYDVFLNFIHNCYYYYIWVRG